MDNTKALQQLLKVFDTSKIVTPEDIQAVLAGIVTILTNNKKSVDALNASNKSVVDQALAFVKDQLAKQQKESTDALNQSAKTTQVKLDQTLAQAQQLVADAKAAMPQDGKNADPADVVHLVMEQIKLPEQKDVILDDGEAIVAKINQNPTDDDDCKIDASHIKNLPVGRNGAMLHGGFRNLTVYDESTILTKAAQFIKFAGAGVQATLSNGMVVVTITGSAGNESNGEVLTPVDSSHFTFAHAPATGGVRNVWRRETGQLLTPTTDYTISGSTLTATSPQVDGDGNAFTLISNYTY